MPNVKENLRLNFSGRLFVAYRKHAFLSTTGGVQLLPVPLLSIRYGREGIYCGDTQTARKEWKRDPVSGRIVNTLKRSE
jgi:hypothetical protein